MNNNLDLIIVIGARPQIMKAAALINALNHSPEITYKLVHSGQHYDHNLSGQFFEEFGIPQPHYNLNIGSHAHNIFIAQFLLGFDPILEEEKPKMVVVVGDTNTTAAAAIASAKRNIALAHIEAGLREFDKSIPEEVNKLLTDAVTDLYFTPTKTGAENLLAQGVTKKLYITGDITLDLLADEEKLLSEEELRKRFSLSSEYVFASCHRQATTNNKRLLREVINGLSALPCEVIWPIHPRTKKAIDYFDLNRMIGKNIKIIDPTSYWETQSLIKYAKCTVTDSGGIIKESYFHKTPGIIIDTQTEWIETVEEGWNRIAGPSAEKIHALFHSLYTPKNHTNALGDGQSALRIVKEIKKYL